MIYGNREHNGTFRGNNLAFIAANEGLNFWKDNKFQDSINIKIKLFDNLLLDLINNINHKAKIKGRGMIKGIEFKDNKVAREVSALCFSNKLIVETCGSHDQVIKLLPPINIEDDHLAHGINILKKSISEVNIEDDRLAHGINVLKKSICEVI